MPSEMVPCCCSDMSWCCVCCSWVVITALSVCACTGAVLAFVFLRGSLPSPYDAVTFTNVGTAGYAGNGGGYTGWAHKPSCILMCPYTIRAIILHHLHAEVAHMLRLCT